MKNVFLLLLFVIFGFVTVNSQINYQDSTVQAITYWRLNESYTYEITQGKNKNKEGGFDEEELIKSEVKVTVIDSTETSYTIEWQFLKHNIPNLDRMPELKNLLDKKRYIYTTDELGEFQELLNWEEVRDNMIATTKIVLNSANSTNDSLNNQVNLFTESLMTKEYVEQKVIEPVNLFHTFFGAEYQLGETLESEIEIPIPLGNIQSIKAQVMIWLDSIDEEYDMYTLCYEQKIDQDVVKKLIGRVINELSDKLNTENRSNIEDEISKQELDHRVTVYSVLDNTGWPVDITATTKINIGNEQQNKLIRIRMMYD